MYGFTTGNPQRHQDYLSFARKNGKKIEANNQSRAIFC